MDKGDSRLLTIIHAMIKADEQNELAAYAPQGSLLTKEELLARAEKAEEDIVAGRVKSVKDLKRA